MKRLVSKYAVIDEALRKVHDLLPGKFVVSLHTGVSSLVLRNQAAATAAAASLHMAKQSCELLTRRCYL